MAMHYSIPFTVMAPMVSFWASSRSRPNLSLGLSFRLLQMYARFSPSGKSPLKNGNRYREEKILCVLGNPVAMDDPPVAR